MIELVVAVLITSILFFFFKHYRVALRPTDVMFSVSSLYVMFFIVNNLNLEDSLETRAFLAAIATIVVFGLANRVSIKDESVERDNSLLGVGFVFVMGCLSILLP